MLKTTTGSQNEAALGFADRNPINRLLTRFSNKNICNMRFLEPAMDSRRHRRNFDKYAAILFKA